MFKKIMNLGHLIWRKLTKDRLTKQLNTCNRNRNNMKELTNSKNLRADHYREPDLYSENFDKCTKNMFGTKMIHEEGAR